MLLVYALYDEVSVHKRTRLQILEQVVYTLKFFVYTRVDVCMRTFVHLYVCLSTYNLMFVYTQLAFIYAHFCT